MCKHQGRFLHLLDDIGHGKGLTGTGYPKQGLELFPVNNALAQLPDGGWLIAGGWIWSFYLKHNRTKLSVSMHSPYTPASNFSRPVHF